LKLLKSKYWFANIGAKFLNYWCWCRSC